MDFRKEHCIDIEILGSKRGRLFQGGREEIGEEVNSVLDILRMSTRHVRRLTVDGCNNFYFSS